MTLEQLSDTSGESRASIKGRILSGLLRYRDGLIPRSDVIKFLREVGQSVAENPPPAPPGGIATPTSAQPDDTAQTDYDPEDPNWTPGCERIRLSTISDALAKVVPERRIVERFSVQWGCSENKVKTYIQRAYAELEALAELGKMRRVHQYRDALAELYAECMTTVGEGDGVQDLKTALQTLDRMIKLDGCYAPTPVARVAVEHSAGESLAAPDRIRERIAALVNNPAIAAKLEALTTGSVASQDAPQPAAPAPGPVDPAEGE